NSGFYIGRLSYRAREKDVEKFFKGYGKILEVDLKNGYGFVEFDDPRDADDAVYDLNGKDLCGERVIVEHTKGPRRDGSYGSGRSKWGFSSYRCYARGGRDRYGPPARTDYRLIVENLSSRCSWQDLKDYMRQAGEVTYADTNKGRRNEGVIEFKLYSDMKRALEKLDGTEVNGRKIRLIEDRPGSRRRRSYSRSRSQSRSRSISGNKDRSRKSRSRSRSGNKDSSRKSLSRSLSRSGNKDRSKKSRSRSKTCDAKSDIDEGGAGPAKGDFRSPSMPQPKSRSPSPTKALSRSPSVSRSDSRSKSRSPSKSPSKSRSRSRS
uniref:RRM domain-containing protein n=1 Tax=Paramormyrops kingsleyae TaxID=1676925 RepID=A0A3B3T452_9TELE